MRFGFAFALMGLCGLCGVFSIRRKTSSRLSASDFDMAKPYDLVDGPVLDALGAFIVRWSYIDRMISSAFVNVLGADRALSYVFTQSTNAATIQGWLRNAIEFRALKYPVENLKDFQALLTHVDEVRAERNALIHGLWERGPAPNTAIVQTVRLERSEVLKEELVTLGDLVDLDHDALRIINDLSAWFVTLGLKKPS
jgi:hypothetical protein